MSFEALEYTANVDALGTLRILEAARISAHSKNAHLPSLHLRALRPRSGDPTKGIHPFHPRSPYGVAKLYAY